MTTTAIKKTIQAFERHLEKKNKHPNTVRSYGNDVGLFFKWMKNSVGDDLRIGEITRSDIVDFRGFLLTRKSSTASVNRRVTALRQFFDYCVEVKFIGENPVSLVQSMPAEPRIPHILSRKDALLLIRSAEQSPRIQDASILLLLLHVGLRSLEIAGLLIGDLYLTPREGRLFIRGQRGKSMRFVYLSTRAQAALKLFCRRTGISILAKRRRSEYLFTQANGQPLTQQYIDHIVKRVGRQCGVSYVTPSMLRNTFAYNALSQGESTETVARSLGVSSVKSLLHFVQKQKSEEPRRGAR